MNHSPAHVLAAALWGGIVAKPPSIVWPLYVGVLPETPDNAVSCYSRQGVRDGRLMINGEVITHPEVAFLIRSTTKEGGWIKTDAIAAAVDAIKALPVSLGGVDYLLQNASREGSPLELGPEEGTIRWLWSLSVNVTVKQVS